VRQCECVGVVPVTRVQDTSQSAATRKDDIIIIITKKIIIIIILLSPKPSIPRRNARQTGLYSRRHIVWVPKWLLPVEACITYVYVYNVGNIMGRGFRRETIFFLSRALPCSDMLAFELTKFVLCTSENVNTHLLYSAPYYRQQWQ